MISRISKKITDYFIYAGIVTEAEKGLYDYGFFILISHVFFFSFTIFIGVVLHIIPAAICFYISFSFLRHYSGGIHAVNEMICFICTTFMLIFSIAGIKFFINRRYDILAIILLLIGIIVIGFISPSDSSAKRLNEAEKNRYKRIALFILGIILLTSILAILYGLKIVVYSLSISVSLESILLIVANLSNLFKKSKILFHL